MAWHRQWTVILAVVTCILLVTAPSVLFFKASASWGFSDAPPAEGSGGVSRAHVVAHNLAELKFQGMQSMPSPDLWVMHTCMPNIYIHVGKTFMYIK